MGLMTASFPPRPTLQLLWPPRADWQATFTAVDVAEAQGNVLDSDGNFVTDSDGNRVIWRQ